MTARTPKRVRGFLALPGEIRNMIYAHYFETHFRCEVAAAGSNFVQPEKRTVKLSTNLVSPGKAIFKDNTSIMSEEPITLRISRRLGKYNLVQGLQTNWQASLWCALNLVCKQVYAETAAFLYQRTVFVFDAPKRIHNFLDVVSTWKLANITSLQLHYNTYGDPLFVSDVVWQDKHRMSWMKACRAAWKKLTGLRKLEIWVQVQGSAPQFNLRERWVLPMLQFRRLTQSAKHVVDKCDARSSHRQLQVVHVHVGTSWTKAASLPVLAENQRLAKACTDLHLLFGQAIGAAILGATEKEAMAGFDKAWKGEHHKWRHHLRLSRTGW